MTAWGGSGDIGCDRSPLSPDWLVLQVPVRALLEGDTVTLRCRGLWNSSVTSGSFYRDGKELETLHDGTELSLSPLQLNHSGHYHCRGWVKYWDTRWKQSPPVTVTVQGAPDYKAHPPGVSKIRKIVDQIRRTGL
ncbi:hypothetical protein TURU_119552 [Turdus rufiventris]|nr:hypothetical protein TURU_119552 [Turdus rufiventris]